MGEKTAGVGQSMNETSPAATSSRSFGATHLVGPVLMAVVGAWALAKAWPMGPDVQVDFGRELYLPWRISEGDRLYTDIAHFNGPLSVYFNALWFKVFGVGLSTLKLVNLSIVIAVAGSFYRLMAAISGRFAASVVGVFFVGAVAFGQFLQLGNYNYLTPYSHELTHGIALSLLGLACFAGLSTGAPRTRVALKTGVILALVLLTKTEVFAAFAAALMIGFALDYWCDRRRFAEASETIKVLALAFVSLLVGFLAVLTLVHSFGSGPEVALSGIVEPWRSLTNSTVTSLPYYKWVMGTQNVSQSLLLILQWSLRHAVFFAVLAGLSLAWRRPSLQRWTPIWGVAFAALVLLFPLDPSSALQAPRPLAIVIPLLLVGFLYQLAQQKQHGDPGVRLTVLRIAVLSFCLVLQLKMALNTQLNHYGFALVVPSLLFFIVISMEFGAGWIARRGGSEWVFRLGVAAGVAWLAIALVTRTDQRFADRVTPIGQGADQMLADARAEYIASTLSMLEETDPDATLAVLPEGVMLNYLTRRVNPTRYINFMPPEMVLYGGNTILTAYRETPPDYVIFIHKNTQLYGLPFFGRHYGRPLYRWVVSNYETVQQLGAIPFRRGAEFGITIYERVVKTNSRDLGESGAGQSGLIETEKMDGGT